MSSNAPLVPSRLEDLDVPNIFVAIDYEAIVNHDFTKATNRIVGTFVSKTKSEVVLLAAGDNAEVIIPIQAITAVWWAPTGYRP